MAAKSFSLDIGDFLIKVADAKREKSQFVVNALGNIPLDKTFFTTDAENIVKQEGEKLAKLLHTLKIPKKNVNIVLSDSVTFNQIVEFPLLNEKELISAMRYQADQFIPMPLEEVNLDVEILMEDKKQKRIEALISAAPKKVIEKLQLLIEQVGLIPEAVETETSAVGRLLASIFEAKKQGENKGFVVMNLNGRTTSLYFFDQRQGLLARSHNFSTGYNLFIKEITVNLNVQPQKAVELLSHFGATKNASYDLSSLLAPAIKQLMTEIQKFISHVKEKQNGQITNIFLINQALQFPSLHTIVQRYFGIPTSIFDMTPHLVRNGVVESNKTTLSYYLSAIGSNLR